MGDISPEFWNLDFCVGHSEEAQGKLFWFGSFWFCFFGLAVSSGPIFRGLPERNGSVLNLLCVYGLLGLSED